MSFHLLTLGTLMSELSLPFRADHVGSLLRPAPLLRARERFAAGELDAAGLRQVEDEAIRDLVRLQADVGLKVATDGEFRRTSWHMDFIYQLGGINRADGEIEVHFENADGSLDFTSAALVVDEPVELPETIFADDLRFLLDEVKDTGQVAKLTMPSPNMVHYRGGSAALDRSVYPQDELFWDDLTAAYAQELQGLYELGCRYVQLDDVSLAYLNDPQQRQMVTERGGDADLLHKDYIRYLNAAIRDRPDDLVVTTHLCRGNYRSSWAASGGYDFVAEELFGDLEVDGFFLEYDDERSGTFEPLRYVPEGKRVVLGLVTTKRGELEDADEIKRRIDEASRYVPLEQLCLSPQCGFSSTVEGNALTHDEQRAKLELVVQVAEDVWG